MSLAAPPTDQRTRWERLQGPTLLAVAVLAASLLLHLRDPHRGGSYGFCPWLMLTGTWCPGCGGLRAVHDLTDADLVSAASSNLLLVTSAPALLLWWARTVRDRWQGVVRAARPRSTALLAFGFLAVAVGFAVVRNTPAGWWLAP